MQGDDMSWVDTHFHMIDRRALGYGWLDEYSAELEGLIGDYHSLQRNYLCEDFLSQARPAGLTKAVHIEAAFGSDPLHETAFVQSVADRCGIPLAIIAHADLTAPDIRSLLDRQRAYPAFRGVRKLWGANDASSPAFRRGFAELVARDLIYEVASVWSDCFDQIAVLAGDFPGARVVIEHCGLPLQRDRAYLSEWRHALDVLARRDNITCKISGLGVTDHSWTVESIRPVVRNVIEAFGVERCCFGSNWPVDSLYGRTYAQLIDAYREVIADQPAAARQALLSGNASRIYRI